MMGFRQSIKSTLLLLLLLKALVASSDSSSPAAFSMPEGPKLKLGVGLLSFRVPHYRGANQSKNYYIPIPYLTYSSDKVQAEPGFVRGTFWRSGPFSLKISIVLGLAVESKSNHARRGMPNLGHTFEVGPMFVLDLWHSRNKRHWLSLFAPVRQAVEVKNPKLRFQGLGLFAIPFLKLTSFLGKGLGSLKSEFSIGGVYASKSYHEHFYSVAPAYQTPDRPAYQAPRGYSGISIFWILNKKIGPLHLIPFLRYDLLSGVAFKDSPLFKRKNFLAIGLGTALTFYESNE